MNNEYDHLSAWDRDYRSRGHLYGGTPFSLPDLVAGSRVLELGCGNGKSLAAMGKKDWTVTALDYSKRAVSLSEKRCRNWPGIRFIIGDVRRLPFRDNTFDAMFATHIAGHLLSEERTTMVAEIIRVLKPGGTLYFRDFGTGDFRCGKGKQIEEQTFRRGPGSVTHYFTLAEFGKLFSGFRRISVSPDQWNMRVRGRDYPREEVVGVFEKR